MANGSENHQKSISRRDFLRITAIAGLAAGLGVSMGQKILQPEGLQEINETHYLMGTVVNFSVLTPDRVLGEKSIRRTVGEMKRLIAIFDYRFDGSPLAILNREGALQNAPVELLELFSRSLELGTLSQGAFDITVLPVVQAYRDGQGSGDLFMELVNYRNVIIDGRNVHFARAGMSVTLDGVAKGRVVDAGVAVLKDLGFENVLVEAGGDLIAVCSDKSEKDWKVAINNPRPSREGDYIAAFSIRNKAVTTSGDYLNFYSSDYTKYHIIDPRTGRSPAELSSATVISSSATEADALSTALMVLGVRDGLKFIQGLSGVEALLVTKDLVVHRSSGFPDGE